MVENAGLVPLAVVAHLTDAVFFVLPTTTLYLLLKHVHKHAARLMVIAVTIAAGIISVCAVFTFLALQVATDPSYVATFGAAGSQALVLLLLEIQHYGILAAQVFFGLWLAPLGYLAYRSGLFPKALGVILVVATVSYRSATSSKRSCWPTWPSRSTSSWASRPRSRRSGWSSHLLVVGAPSPADGATARPPVAGVAPDPGLTPSRTSR